MKRTISELGEKDLISRLIRPLFSDGGHEGIGDDCAVLDIPSDWSALLTTDRVPADLISFRLKIIDHYQLGQYLVWLNFSDIAACGGKPKALLLNFALPGNMLISDLEGLCNGIYDSAKNFNATVIGGDMSNSSELSVSATAVGVVERNKALLRSGAHAGDHVFCSRPIGLTPAAFSYFLNSSSACPDLSTSDVLSLKNQFTDIPPLVDLGRLLVGSQRCTSCMDNTDGIGQTLIELASESRVGIEINRELLDIPPLVKLIASFSSKDKIDLSLGPGADFSLVGTLDGSLSISEIEQLFGGAVKVIGSIFEGNGVYLSQNGECLEIEPRGWNYFTQQTDF